MPRKPGPLATAGLVAAAIAIVQGLFVLWFAWPGQNMEPRDLPVVVAGPNQATGPTAERLRQALPGADITMLDDATAADESLRDRTAYAAFVVDGTGLSVHVASAASPTIASMITQSAQVLGGGGQGAPVDVVDIVPAPADDPRGGGFAGGFLPLIMTSIACAVTFLFLIASHRIRVAGLVVFALAAGLVSGGLLQARGLITGDYLPAAGVIALLVLSISAAVSGLGVVLGNPGIALSSLTVFFVGNPISGLTGAPELLPQPWGTIGQFLPPGAGATLLRSVAFFDGAGAMRPLLVLGAWAAGGIALTAVGHFRDQACQRAGSRQSGRQVLDASGNLAQTPQLG